MARCQEPQTIHDLLKKYGVTCSAVWNPTTSLSARSPCAALLDHNMPIVHADVLGHNHVVEADKMTQFYHNMKHIRVKTRHRVLRRKNPYSIGTRGITLYYSDTMSTLRKVIAEDGRFISSAKCVDSKGRSVDDERVSELKIKFNKGLTILGKAASVMVRVCCKKLVLSLFLFLFFKVPNTFRVTTRTLVRSPVCIAHKTQSTRIRHVDT